MGPLRSILSWGGEVIGVDLPRQDIWKRVLDVAASSAGTLHLPVPGGARWSAGDLATHAGADLLHGLPAIADWLTEVDGPLVLGNYVYADGATNVRVSTAVDVLSTELMARRADVALAFLATPTDVFACRVRPSRISFTLIAWQVFNRVADREPRTGAEKHRRVAVDLVQIDEDRTAGRQGGERRRHVDGHRRGPDPALGADKREHGPRGGHRALPQEAVHRGAHLRLRERFGNAFVHTRAHRFEHQRGIHRRRNQDHVDRRMLPLQQRQRGWQPVLAAHVDQDDVRLGSLSLQQGVEIGDPRRGRDVIRSAQQFLDP